MGLFSFLNRKKYKESQPKTMTRLSQMSGGTLIYDDTAMQVSAFYRGVIYIATQLAKLPWDVKDSQNNVMNHRISKMLRLTPNPEVNSFMLRSFLIQQAIIFGNGYAEIERDNAGRPVALWPIPSRHVDPIRTAENNELVYRVIGGGISQQSPDAILTKNEIFHLRNFHTKDGVVGLGLIEYAAESLGTAKGADKFANSLYSNGGLPSGVLTIDGKLSEEGLKRVKESWESAHGGRKTGGTAILEDGLSYSSISHDPQVLQFLESRQFSVLEIARFLGLPPTKLFDTKATTFNNIENANLEVVTDTLDAWARNMEMEADIKLLSNSNSGYRTEIDMQAVFRGDMETRSQYFTRMMQVGAITPNEIRKAEGKAPYEGGDRYYIATNNYTPSDRVDEVVDAQAGSKEPEQEPSDRELNEAVSNYLRKNL